MKTSLISFALLLGSSGLATAQQFLLPVSSASQPAKAAYYKAADLASNSRIPEARAQLDSALKADPTFFMAYVSMIFNTSGEKKAGLINKALALDAGKLTKAEKILREQLVKWQADPKAKAGQTMTALVAAYPKNPQAYEWATQRAVYTDKDTAAALAYTQKLAQVNPKFAPNYNNMGYMYMYTQQMDKAKVAFEQYIAHAPQEANAYDSMGEYYMNVKDYAKSAEYYDKATAMGYTVSKERAEKARAMMSAK